MSQLKQIQMAFLKFDFCHGERDKSFQVPALGLGAKIFISQLRCCTWKIFKRGEKNCITLTFLLTAHFPLSDQYVLLLRHYK